MAFKYTDTYGKEWEIASCEEVHNLIASDSVVYTNIIENISIKPSYSLKYLISTEGAVLTLEKSDAISAEIVIIAKVNGKIVYPDEKGNSVTEDIPANSIKVLNVTNAGYRPSIESSIISGSTRGITSGAVYNAVNTINNNINAIHKVTTVTSTTTVTPAKSDVYVITAGVTLTLSNTSTIGSIVTVVGDNASATVSYMNASGTSTSVRLGKGGIAQLVSVTSGYADMVFNAVWN